MGGLEICCGAWAVRHFLLGHPIITLSRFPSFSDGQGNGQALQLPPNLGPSELCDWRSCSWMHVPTRDTLGVVGAQVGVLAREYLVTWAKTTHIECAIW